MFGQLRKRFVAGWIFATLLSSVATQTSAQVHVRAPFVDVISDPGGVRVCAPFVDVRTRATNTRVRAPFTNVNEDRRAATQYAAAAQVPAGLPMVRVELEGGSPANGSAAPGDPAGAGAPSVSEPMPASVRERRLEQSIEPSRESKPERSPKAALRGNAVADEASPAAEYSPYLVVPIAPGQSRPRLRAYVEAASPQPEPTLQTAPTARRADGVPPAPAAELTQSTAPAAVSDAQVIRLQPTWHTEVPRYFQPTAGLHVIALVHPYTRQTVAVQLDLPQGQPRIKIGSDRLEFDYGRLEVEIRFRQDGRVVVRTNR